MSQEQEKLYSAFWDEEPEADNPFAARAAYCAGYDVYGDLLGKASYIDYLYLLFKGEAPEPWQHKLLETLAIALANPGPREPSVQAAMSAGAGGSTSASALIAAIATGAGSLGGAREVLIAMQWWQELGCDVQKWQQRIAQVSTRKTEDVWLDMEHIPGFDPNGTICPRPTIQTLSSLALKTEKECSVLHWLGSKREALQQMTGLPLSLAGLAAATYHELSLTPQQGEMLHMLLRLPGAAAHALEQQKLGHKKFPFFGDGLSLLNDPQHQAINAEES